MNAVRTFSLLGILLVSVAAAWWVGRYHVSSFTRSDAAAMHAAADLAESLFEQIGELKRERQITVSPAVSPPRGYLIGDDFTEMTTTLGALSAKVTATSPDFAALIAHLLITSGIDSTRTVGIVLSGSFPSLGISALAAVQTLGARAVVISSLGSSTYGANQPGATWIDMESRLFERGLLKHRSSLVTLGGENDDGGGILDEGVAAMEEAARRNGVSLYRPGTLEESIRRKTELMASSGVDVLINIGGNQASLGSCAHALSIPNGLHREYVGCNDANRGIIVAMAAGGTPFIHLLNIKDLAVRWGIPLDPASGLARSESLYTVRRASPLAAASGVGIIGLLLIGFKLKTVRSVRRWSVAAPQPKRTTRERLI